jgi:hypothetical protein
LRHSKNCLPDAERLVAPNQHLRHEFGLAISLTLTACAYRLPVATLPSQYRLKLVTKSPELFIVKLNIGDPREYHVLGDGRVTLDVPGYRNGCSVYLFDRIRVRRAASPLRAKSVEIVKAGTIARLLSLKDIARLVVDGSGYHLLTLEKTP